MPEGDTIHRIARQLAPLLVGRTLRAVTSHGGMRHPALSGRRVERLVPQGKHLTFLLDDGTSIRCHLGMQGRWHHYAPGAAWRRAAAGAALVLDTGADVLVCFGARDVELRGRRDPRAGAVTARLGPDLLAPGPLPVAELLGRVRLPENARRTIGELLLDQRVASGVGNIYRSEALFLENLDPWIRVRWLSDEQLAMLYLRLQKLMRRNVVPRRDGGPELRRTTDLRSAADAPTGSPALRPPSGRYWVYGRTNRPCARCGEPVASALQGEQRRRTYYCPRCQGASGSKGSDRQR